MRFDVSVLVQLAVCVWFGRSQSVRANVMSSRNASTATQLYERTGSVNVVLVIQPVVEADVVLPLVLRVRAGDDRVVGALPEPGRGQRIRLQERHAVRRQPVDGMMLPGNGWPVVGLVITRAPVKKPLFGSSSSLKLPWRIAAVGTVMIAVCSGRSSPTPVRRRRTACP